MAGPYRTPFTDAAHPGSWLPLCSTNRTGPRKTATVTTAPSAVCTRKMLTRGWGFGLGFGFGAAAGVSAGLGLCAPAADAAAAGVVVARGGAAGALGLAVHAAVTPAAIITAHPRRTMAAGRMPSSIGRPRDRYVKHPARVAALAPPVVCVP